jgi:hypothetical protein
MTARGDEVVERALALSHADGCIVLAEHRSGANLRWAGNTLTTNGETRGRSVTVISVVGQSVGVRSATSSDGLEDLVRASEQAARDAEPAEDAGPLVEGAAADDFAEPAELTSAAVFERFAPDLGAALTAAGADGLDLYGFASHDVTTTWLGSSTGLRLRHVQPTGYVELTGKSSGGSSWVGQHTRDWTDVAVGSLDAEVRRRLAWGARQVELPGRPVRDAAAAVGRRRPHGLRLLDGVGAQRGPRAGPSSAHPAAQPGWASACGPAGLRMTSDPTDPSLGTTPFVATSASSAMSSVFDNGLPLTATDWMRDGALTALVQTRPRRRGPARPSRRTSTASRSTGAGRPPPTRWWRGPSAGCC